jgi:DNA polymerase-4
MSCSYPARAFGIKPGMLLPEAHRRCPHAIFRRGDSQAAKRLRESVAHILMRTTPLVEVASIDDFFADLTGTARAQGAAFTVAEQVRSSIRTELSLPVTIGIGANRTMARLAGKLAKPGGIAEILPGHELAFLSSLPLEHLPGAGHQIGRMLERFGITRAGELLLVPREVLFASFGSLGLTLHERARGIDPEPIEATFTQDAQGNWIEKMPRSIRRDSTFEPEEGRREIVEAMLGYLVERAAHKLRGHRAVARSIAVRVQYVDTRSRPGDHPAAKPREAPSSFEKRAKLVPPTDSTDVLLQRTLAIWRALPRRRALVKRVGITLVDLARGGGWQRTLFDDERSGGERQEVERAEVERREAGSQGSSEGAHDARESRADRQRRIDIALDTLRARHGFGRILRGTSFPLSANHELLPDGYRLRTPSLNQ